MPYISRYRLTIGPVKRPWSGDLDPKTQNYGPSPYPCQLNDCWGAVKYMNENKAKYNISTVITSGESAGGNMATALALHAKKEGCLDMIDGVFSMCP